MKTVAGYVVAGVIGYLLIGVFVAIFVDTWQSQTQDPLRGFTRVLLFLASVLCWPYLCDISSKSKGD